MLALDRGPHDVRAFRIDADGVPPPVD